MTRNGTQELKALFQRAVELEPEARRSYLDEACAGRADLRREVEALLEADRDPAGLLEERVPRLLEGDRRPVPETLLGRSLGGHRLEEVLAEGGMGTVFLATQHQPERRVALKVTRFDGRSTEERARFDREARILGLLNHRHIAKVHAAGIEELDGRPLSYLAMEYVEGAQDLCAYARSHRLDRAQRLRLFTDLCDAVQHGHQKGIVHRDLKPANVLVDASGELKVIDFGIASLRAQDGSDTSRRGEGEHVLGTLQYMSPEQCSAGEDVDTRSDVYSLGILLHELLTGRPPYSVERGNLLEAARRIQAARSVPIAIGAGGDLELIVAKALEKDRERRYDSAAALAADVRAFLRGQPVAAHAPGAWYSLRRFVARNRALVTLGVGLVSALVALVLLMAWNARAIERQRDEAASLARMYRRSTDFFARFLDQADPKRGGRERTAIEVLDAVVPEIPRLLAGEPEVELVVRELVASKLFEQGRFGEAEEQRRGVLALLERSQPDPVTLARAHAALAEVLLVQGRAEEAREPIHSALGQLDRHEDRGGAGALWPLRIASQVASSVGDAQACREHLERALAIAEEQRGPERVAIVEIWQELAARARWEGDADRALELARRALAESRALIPEGDPSRHTPELYVAHYLWSRASAGDLEEAERLLRTGREALRASLGPRTFEEVVWSRQLGRVVGTLGRGEEALAEMERAVDLAHALLGDEHFEVGRTHKYAGDLYQYLGRREEALVQWRRTLEIYEACYPPDSDALRTARERVLSTEEALAANAPTDPADG